MVDLVLRKFSNKNDISMLSAPSVVVTDTADRKKLFNKLS